MRFLSIHTKLTASLVFVTCLGVGTTGYFSIRAGYEALKRQKQQDELAMAVNIAAQVDETLLKAKETVVALARHPDIRGMNPAVQRKALTLATQVTELIDGILVADREGRVLVVDEAGPESETPLSADVRRDFILPVPPSGDVSLLPVVRTKSEELVAPITAPVRERGGVVGFVTGLILLERHTLGGIEGIRIGRSGYAFLVDEQGRIIVHPQREHLFQDLGAYPPLQKLMSLHRAGVTEFVNQDGIDLLAAYAPVKGTGWGVVVRQPTSESYDLARRVTALMVAVSALCLAAAVGVGFRFGHWITRPLFALDAGVRRIAAGDLDARLETSGGDEVGRLAAAFNEMAGKLKENIAAIRRAHEESLHALERLSRSEKLAAVGQLAAGIAHEINNPLNIISGFAEVLFKKTAPGDPSLSALSDIMREAERCQRLVRKMLDFARPRETEKALCDAGRLLEESVELVRATAEQQGVRVACVPAGGLPPVEASTDELKQVFLNLLLNACQAMPSGGRLTCRTRREGDFMRLDVEDTGYGIPPENLERVFYPFFTTKENGTGLGLALSHAIVERHGGRLEVASQVGKGSVFSVLLPLKEEKHAVPA